MIAGLPWLAGVFTGLFGLLVGFFTKYMTKRIAIAVVGVGVLVTVTTSFMAGMYALTSTITASAPTDIALAMGLFMPANYSACIAACLSAHVLKWAYTWQTKVIQYKLL